MNHPDTPSDLTGVLNCLEKVAPDQRQVSLEQVLEAVGGRSFGPLLLVPGLIVFSPLSGIPGIPSLMALMISLVTVQMLIGRHHIWLPRWLLTRRVRRSRLRKTLRWMKRPASWVDSLLKPRFAFLTRGPSLYIAALLCLALALIMPPLELIPFANTVSGAAICCLSISLITRDGVATLLSMTLVAGLMATIVLALT
jgi:hypothetical protein